MSFDIPVSIEPQIQRYADERHLTIDEAIVKLLEAGLGQDNVALSGLGLFGDPEDAEALDAAVDLAYEERRRPSTRATGL